MRPATAYTAFLLDLDGVLVDTEPLQFEAYRRALEEHGVQLDWTLEEYCLAAHFGSVRLRRLLAKLAPGLIEPEANWRSIYNHKNALYLELLAGEGAALQPGVTELLTILRREGISHAVVTHSSRHAIEMLRTGHPVVDAVPHWITREDYVAAKPQPDAYLTALGRLDLQADEAIGLEDSPRGLAALCTAGIDAFLVSRILYPDLDEPRFGSPRVVETLQEIVDELS